MMRTHTCGELRLEDCGKEVILCGWVQKSRDLGGMTFVDLRDRYGITQAVFSMDDDPALCDRARRLGREFVVRVHGTVRERSNKNPQLPTGDIELKARQLEVLNKSKVPPFTIEKETDGGDDLRMQYRYLDLRRPDLRTNMELRHRMARATRAYLDKQGFLEIETPFLIKTTPEGARDFIVPSRLNPGKFYALPQSPQTFKQLLMVAGFDRYFQLVKCFRDEDLRADRQPEFTQIDCEMSFVDREDVLETFEGLMRHLFREIRGIDPGPFPRMSYAEALETYGTDKPDLRFGMPICDISSLARGHGFGVFDQAGLVACITVPGAAGYSRKQLDVLTDFVKKPQVGAKGLVYVKWLEDGQFKSSVDKFFDPGQLQGWADKAGASPGDLLLIMAGDPEETRRHLGILRLEMAERLGLRKEDVFKPLWVVDFPLLEWDEEENRFTALHHPFTSPRADQLGLLESDPGAVLANAYDMVINGVEVGGGSIRIHDRKLQEKVFELLGFSREEAREKFGFLMGAFEYGAPPHGGIAFGFDRLCALFAGQESIRDFIAFPKNNAGRDVMLDAPSEADQQQLNELYLDIRPLPE